MKRFGLRALAGTLATLMVVSAFAPAKAASAADDILLIAPNPNALKTLYITEDMVDEDGEIVISGGSYDRVVVAKEVAAKDIYFDQVTVGEMVVESGGESRIQLWEVDAEQVTVQEPELEALSLLDIKDLLKDEETRAAALEMYKESQAKDAKTKKTAPKIVTKEDAKVDTLVARANVTLDLADGEVNEVALEGSEKVDRAKVTLKNYTGDVSFKGTEGKSNMTLNNVDSRIKTLKVEESNANNYFAVNARNSVVLKAEVAGNARFALNALTGALEVTEEATAANITLLNTIEEMNIAGDNAVIDVAPCGRVETAAITGDKANVSGSGTLVAVEITGEGAYVSTFGTDVEGENTYVPPVYVPPEVPKVVVKDIDLVADEGAEVVKNANGSATITFSDQYKKAYFNVPDSVDINRISKVIMNITASGGFGLKIHTTEGVDITSNSWFPSGNGEAADYSYEINPARQKVAKLEFMSTVTGQSSFTVNSITFELLDEAPEVEEKPLVTENKTYTFKDMKIDWKAEGVSNTIDANGAMKVSYPGQWQSIVCRFPIAIDPVDYPEIVVNLESPNGEVGIKAWQVGEEGDENNNPKINSWNNQPATATDIKMDISNALAPIEKVEFVSSTAASYEAIINSITLIGSGNVGKNEGGTGNEKEEADLTGATKCDTNDWQVHHFTDYNLVNYVGQKITYSVDMVKTSGGTAEIKAQDSGYKTIYQTADITDTWKTFTYTITVPDEYKDMETAYVGFRWTAQNSDYADYTFYFKNFKFEVAEEEKVTDFYVAKDVAFNDVEVIDSNGNIVAQLEALNLAGDNLVNTLPAALTGDAASYKTLEGIMSKIDYFEFSVTLTEGTPKEGLDDGIYWAPQAQIQAQSTNYSEGTWNLGLTQEQNATLCVNLGQATESNPKTGTGKLYTEYFEGWTSKDQYTLNMLQIQFLNAELGTFVSGTYSIKAVLK